MENELKHFKTFRYETLNEESKGDTVLYVLHGYGQLAKFFIKKFQSLDKTLLIVAPEGMHRFYKNGNSGRVGASWMTKESRHTDIDDNIDWLTQLDKLITEKFEINKRILLGFSQGGATAIRWKWEDRVIFDSTIIWASDFPPDLNESTKFKSESNNHFVLGTNDQFFDNQVQSNLIEVYNSIGFKISTYLGQHDIEEDTLNKVINTAVK